ncbi:MAG: hypothetical protein QOH92_2328 [Chloroflexota bacterium]|jgi:hypothetical protein|nr:hypothetical protein [Chloroflexota bacterium]
MPHRHDDEYLHRHALDAAPHRHRLIEVIEHAHGAHGDDRHDHTHIIMTAPAESGGQASQHRHRLASPFEHEHPSDDPRHRHQLGEIEHEERDRHWHGVEITEIEMTIEPPKRRRD